MNLQFTNKGGNFVSEFEVTSDFNLHIEGVRLSDMHIYQKTAGGSYAKVTDFPSERSQDRVADFDFASLVYPKFIKVVCATEPTNAELVTDGEVTEIKSQSKEVEITANGVTEIAPDAGFGYLSGVKVNVNVPQSGGGESGGGDAPSGGGSDILYLRCEDMLGTDAFAGIYMNVMVATPAVLIGVKLGEMAAVFNVATALELGGNTSALKTFERFVFAVVKNVPYTRADMTTSTINTKEDVVSAMSSYGTPVNLSEITKEEFYNLEA